MGGVGTAVHDGGGGESVGVLFSSFVVVEVIVVVIVIVVGGGGGGSGRVVAWLGIPPRVGHDGFAFFGQHGGVDSAEYHGGWD